MTSLLQFVRSRQSSDSRNTAAAVCNLAISTIVQEPRDAKGAGACQYLCRVLHTARHTLSPGWLVLTAAAAPPAEPSGLHACNRVVPRCCCIVSHPGRPSLGLPFSIVATHSTLPSSVPRPPHSGIASSGPFKTAAPRPSRQPITRCSHHNSRHTTCNASHHHHHLAISNQDTTPRRPNVSTDWASQHPTPFSACTCPRPRY